VHERGGELPTEQNAGPDSGRRSDQRDGRSLPRDRERVKLYGGEMTAGTANGGGFILKTRLPLPEPRA
jgi:hypothetical protein